MLSEAKRSRNICGCLSELSIDENAYFRKGDDPIPYAHRGVELASKHHGFDGPTTRIRMRVRAHDLAPARSVFAAERNAVHDPAGG